LNFLIDSENALATLVRHLLTLVEDEKMTQVIVASDVTAIVPATVLYSMLFVKVNSKN